MNERRIIIVSVILLVVVPCAFWAVGMGNKKRAEFVNKYFDEVFSGKEQITNICLGKYMPPSGALSDIEAFINQMCDCAADNMKNMMMQDRVYSVLKKHSVNLWNIKETREILMDQAFFACIGYFKKHTDEMPPHVTIK